MDSTKKTESSVVQYLKERGWDKSVITDLLDLIRSHKPDHPTEQISRVRPNPIVIVRGFLVLQTVAILVYLIVGSLTHYAQIYRSLKISQAISFQIAQAVFILLTEIILVFYIFFRWQRESYEIKVDQIVHAKGIFYRRRTVVPLSHVASVVYHQGPLGKLVQYGTIELKDAQTKEIVRFKHIPEPHNYVNLIVKIKQQQEAMAGVVGFSNYQPGLTALLETGESDAVEFKSTFRWDTRENKVNRGLEKATMKTIAAFLNSRGGHLVLGVDDQKTIIGLKEDFVTLGKENPDGFENHFSHVFANMIGPEFRQFVRLHWAKVDDKDCCIVTVSPTLKPAYLKSEDNEEFYIRTGNGTTSLKFSEASAYIESRFKSKLV